MHGPARSVKTAAAKWGAKETMEQDRGRPLNLSEETEAKEHKSLRALIVYEAVRRDGEEQLHRPTPSLWWSGLAAGIGISVSLAAEGALRHGLPDAPWRPMVESFGYAAGFLIVILSRQQLFTENTLTAVLPVLHPPTGRNVLNLLRVWGVVFVANLIGVALFAWAVTAAPVLPQHIVQSMVEVARELAHKPFGEVFWRAIPAGWLIAALVWMMTSAETGKVWVIIIMTYLVALFGLTHVIAGAAEVLLLVFKGEMALGVALGGFILPMLIGNVIGGSALFALLAFGQVEAEVD